MSDSPTDRSVVHLGSAADQGGAARASWRIHEGVAAQGWRSRMLVGIPPRRARDDVDVVVRQSQLAGRAIVRLVHGVEQLSGYENQLLPWGRRFLRHAWVRDASVVHLHNLHGGWFSTRALADLPPAQAVVWSVHDLWPLTGHCYYPELAACDRWLSGCGRCPALRQESYYPLSRDTTAGLWRLKRRIYAALQPHVIAQSNWTAEQLKRSPLLGECDLHLIPYGLDLDVFRPLPKPAARQTLGLRPDATIIFFAAVGLSSERKGWPFLREALAKLRERTRAPFVLLVAGGDPIPEQTGFETVQLGPLQEERLMAAAYSAADVFVGASLCETFGQVFSEAMACGLPAVCFDTSGVRDVVRHMETGYRAPLRDVDALAGGLELLLEDASLRESMGRRGREIALAEFSLDLQARRVVAVYEQALESRRGRG